MTRPTLDAETAWTLIQSLATQTTPGPCFLPGREEPVLTVGDRGDWQLHATPADRTADDLLQCFVPLCLPTRDPVVYAQVGQSLDGRIATVTGASQFINGDGGLDHLHRLRAVADIVVVGAGTAASDRPRLTVRRVEGSNPDRAVIDPNRRVDRDQSLFDQRQASTYCLVREQAEHADEIGIPCPSDCMTPEGIIAVLRERGYRRIFIEGGSCTVSHFLEAGCLDHLHVIVAPMIIGSGIPGIQLPAIDSLDGALRPEWASFNLGSDYLFDMRLRSPAAAAGS
ncbi:MULTISPECIES: RibD family protein [Marinobacter]|uniref:RibD family protein n=1 Tax=Marinobacter TaxID=2742 RepID=UPI000DACC090|nr:MULTISPECIES: RibD family protein [Marinobacter]